MGVPELWRRPHWALIWDSLEGFEGCNIQTTSLPCGCPTAVLLVCIMHASKEPRRSRDQTSPHRLTHEPNVVVLPRDVGSTVLHKTQAALDLSAACPTRLRAQLQGGTVNVRGGLVHTGEHSVAWFLMARAIAVWSTPAHGPMYEEVNCCELFQYAYDAVEVGLLGNGYAHACGKACAQLPAPPPPLYKLRPCPSYSRRRVCNSIMYEMWCGHIRRGPLLVHQEFFFSV